MSINVMTVDGLNQDVTVDLNQDIEVTMGEAIVIVDCPTYDGSYEFTPTKETQIVSIANKRAVTDITINPIPSNYGLITWDGATLTVS